MMKLKHLPLVLAGCLLLGSGAESVQAQSRMDRDRHWDQGRDWNDRDWQDRDRDWDRSRRWRERDRDCYYVRRESRDRFGDIIVRRYRVCDD
jgi:hypothetical protein